jgi:hypothetical protein
MTIGIYMCVRRSSSEERSHPRPQRIRIAEAKQVQKHLI